MKLRKEYRNELGHGTVEVYNMEDPKLFSHIKSFEDMKALVLLNVRSEEQDLQIPPSLQGKNMELLVADVAQLQHKLTPWEARTYVVR